MEFAPKLIDLKINSILMNLQPVNPLENDFNVENGNNGFYFVAKLLYNSLCPSVTLWGNCNFLGCCLRLITVIFI